jgi:hypothetical protein
MHWLSKDLPPKSPHFNYFDLWSYDATLEDIHHTLFVKCREAMGREASPTACIIDSQSFKGAEIGGLSIDPNGYDANKSAPRRRASPMEEEYHSDSCRLIWKLTSGLAG